MPPIEFRVLGPFEVLVEGRALELKRPKQRSLLALLLLHAGEVVSTDRLVDELWAGKPPKAAVGSLQNLVSDLRKALGRDVCSLVHPATRSISIPTGSICTGSSGSWPGGGRRRRPSGARASCTRRSALWRGPALADLAFEPFALLAIARLEELRTAAREELLRRSSSSAATRSWSRELEALVAEHPLRERLRGQLMLALYRSGRQAEALDAYRQARETLVEELGIEPSSELQQLEQSILRHDRELDLARSERRKPLRRAGAAEDRDGPLHRRRRLDEPRRRLDPEVLRVVMRRYFDTVRTIVERHGGTVEKFIGDAAMAVFGVPQMHEDDALRAVRAANELREALVGPERRPRARPRARDSGPDGDQHRRSARGRRGSGQPFATGVADNGCDAATAGRASGRDAAR